VGVEASAWAVGGSKSPQGKASNAAQCSPMPLLYFQLVIQDIAAINELTKRMDLLH
jgi:hypothetical protein